MHDPDYFDDDDIAEMERALTFWKVIERFTGWKLYGFTYRVWASFDTGDGHTLQFNHKQRDDLVAAFYGTNKERK